jgi:glycosyltransferase involved in cell wall biosynthesis
LNSCDEARLHSKLSAIRTVVLTKPLVDAPPFPRGARRRLLVVATYPVSGAATRYRTVSYFDALAERGIDADLCTFYDDQEFSVLYSGGLLRNARSTVNGVARLLAIGSKSRRYDAVLVQREAAPLGPAWLETFLQRRRHLPLIFDFDDAVWLNQHDKSAYPRLARWLRPDKSLGLIRVASAVIAGSHALARKARELNEAVSVLPTTVPAAGWRPAPGKAVGALASDVPLIGWIGTHSTAPQLEIALRALERIEAQGLRFNLRVVGAMSSLPRTTLPVQSQAWRLEREVQDFQALDIGLAPMFDDPWSAGKCGFKQLQYMASGVPMVSSLVGGAREFLSPEQDALFATTEDEWTAQLTRLLVDADLRRRLAEGAYAKFLAELSTEAQSERFVEVVRGVVNQRATGE